MRRGEFVSAIILAAGQGSRMCSDITKQKMNICGKSVIWRAVDVFNRSSEIDSIVVVCREEEIEWMKDELCRDFNKIHAIVVGGKTRAESARCGFNAILDNTTFVAIHDGARCLVTEKIVSSVLDKAIDFGAATAASAATDTIKIIDEYYAVKETVPRNQVMAVQTPQIFSKEIYSKALESNIIDLQITDDNMLVESIGQKVYCVDTGKDNIKITTPGDIKYAEYIIEGRSVVNDIRVGHGYDVHRLTENRRLIIGGVDIPYDKGLLGHSDADVLTHAIMDALLGACGLGDIGRHFPDSSNSYKDISSLVLLRTVKELVEKQGYSVSNIDATLVMQKPKIAPYIEMMVDNISEILGIERGRINIKATTEEKLGFTGREEGVSAHAVATLIK